MEIIKIRDNFIYRIEKLEVAEIDFFTVYIQTIWKKMYPHWSSVTVKVAYGNTTPADIVVYVFNTQVLVFSNFFKIMASANNHTELKQYVDVLTKRIEAEFGLLAEDEDISISPHDVRSMTVTNGGKLRFNIEDGDFQIKTLAIPMDWTDMQFTDLYAVFKKEKADKDASALRHVEQQKDDVLKATRAAILNLIKVMETDPSLKEIILQRLTKGDKHA